MRARIAKDPALGMAFALHTVGQYLVQWVLVLAAGNVTAGKALLVGACTVNSTSTNQ